MKEEFYSRLINRQYISKKLYSSVKDDPYSEKIIPKDFDLDKYNDNVIKNIYLNNRSYFDNMYSDIDSSIHLDYEQIKSIITDEEYCLIIAGAGTGKTTTMASKVKYLVDILKIDPSKILVISYTRKSTYELIQRINVEFEIPARIMTFHALGFSYIREIFKGHKCYVVDENLKNNIFLDYFEEKIFSNKRAIRTFFDTFDPKSCCTNWLFNSFLINNYEMYNTYDELFKAYKRDKISKFDNLKDYVTSLLDFEVNQECIRTIKNEVVKSKGEAIIANYLFMHNVDYYYEQVFPEVVDSNKTYRPDFTINYEGNPIYIEYFGLSSYKGDKLERYKKNMKKKIDYHKKHNTNFISIDCTFNENIIFTLENELKKYNIPLKMKSYEEIYSAMLDRNQLVLLFPLRNLFYKVIEFIKSSPDRNNYVDICKKYFTSLNNEESIKANRQLYYIDDFYHFYQNRLYGDPISYGFDFPDMIYYANQYLKNIKSNELDFRYIVIDEYQDISYNNYKLTQNIAYYNNCKIVAVGDDWQSIYSFNGAKLKYIYDFQNYFPYSKILNISKTYRNCQKLIDSSGEFIMKNKNQIRKNLISNKDIKDPIRFVYFESGEEYIELKKLIIEIHKKNPSHNILILGRTNKVINNCYDDKELIDSVDTKVKFLGYEDIDIDAMTIHKSKGLTSDEVIIIGLDQSFPSSHSNFWLCELFSNKVDFEGVSYPEERRIFYVGLTRTKNYVYLLVNKDPNCRSPFIEEIMSLLR